MVHRRKARPSLDQPVELVVSEKTNFADWKLGAAHARIVIIVTIMVVAEKYTNDRGVRRGCHHPGRSTLTNKLVPHWQNPRAENVEGNRQPSHGHEDQPDMPALNNIIRMIELGKAHNHGRDEIRHASESQPPTKRTNTGRSGSSQCQCHSLWSRTPCMYEANGAHSGLDTTKDQ